MDKITNSVLNSTNRNILKDNIKAESFDKSISSVETVANEKVVDLSDIKSVASNLAKSAPVIVLNGGAILAILSWLAVNFFFIFFRMIFSLTFFCMTF